MCMPGAAEDFAADIVTKLSHCSRVIATNLCTMARYDMARLAGLSRMEVSLHLTKFERIILNGAERKSAAPDGLVRPRCGGIVLAFQRNSWNALRVGGLNVCLSISGRTLTGWLQGRDAPRRGPLRAMSQ